MLKICFSVLFFFAVAIISYCTRTLISLFLLLLFSLRNPAAYEKEARYARDGQEPSFQWRPSRYSQLYHCPNNIIFRPPSHNDSQSISHCAARIVSIVSACSTVCQPAAGQKRGWRRYSQTGGLFGFYCDILRYFCILSIFL